VSNEANQAALAEAWSGTVTPYSQIKDSLGLEGGQYDFLVGKLEPTLDKNGLYCIAGEFPVLAPTGFQQPYKRTLYVGTHKDKLAKLPETRLNSPGLRFLKNIAKANDLPTNDQSDAALCAQITGRAFGCRVEETEYESNGVKKKGSDFGRNVTPAGAIPAKLDKVAAAPMSNGHDTGAAAGAEFGA